MNGGLEKMLGFGNYKKESDILENPSRREFLEKVGKGALVAGLTATGYLKSETALAYELKDLPPGFQICKDETLVKIYIMMLRHETNKLNAIKGALIGNGKLGDIYTGFINDNTPLTEPAYWFAKDYFNYKFVNGDRSYMIDTNMLLSKFNIQNGTPMYNWAKGINMYFRTWVDSDKRYGSIQETEIYLLRAIFTAGGRSESEVENYKQLDLTLKERMLNSVMQDLSKKDYTNQLIAAWAGFWLGIHYEIRVKNGPESDIIYNQIEMPLRKLNSNFKIRGPPHYYGV